MDNVVSFSIAILIILIVLVGFPTMAHRAGYKDAMQQAYDRGYAVQCIGKTGYYWECE